MLSIAGEEESPFSFFFFFFLLLLLHASTTTIHAYSNSPSLYLRKVHTTYIHI